MRAVTALLVVFAIAPDGGLFAQQQRTPLGGSAGAERSVALVVGHRSVAGRPHEFRGSSTGLRPGGARAKVVVLELLGAVVGGLGIGVLGGVLGEDIRGEPEWECSDCPGNVGAGEGFALGMAFGSTLAVAGIGSAFGERGSFFATLLGAAAPAVLGVTVAEAGRDPHAGFLAALISLGSPLGATLAYNLSKPRNEAPPRSIEMAVVPQPGGALAFGASVSF